MIQNFSQRLRHTLSEQKLSQTKVASALNLSRTAVNKWIKGGLIDEANLTLLAEFLNVDKVWLKYGHLNNELIKNIDEIHVIQEAKDVVTWVWDLLTDTLHYSNNVESVYGINIKSNNDFWNLLSKKDRIRIFDNYAELIKNGSGHEIDFTINKYGKKRWITSRATGVRDDNGKITKLIGISLDNTERKNKEIKLNKINSCFNILLNHINDFVVFTDLEGEIITSNYDQHHIKQSLHYVTVQQLIYQCIYELDIDLLTSNKENKIEIYKSNFKLIFYSVQCEDKQSYLLFEIENCSETAT